MAMADTPMSMAMSEGSDDGMMSMDGATPTPAPSSRSARRLSNAAAAAAAADNSALLQVCTPAFERPSHLN
jgi:hypothetical protein